NRKQSRSKTSQTADQIKCCKGNFQKHQKRQVLKKRRTKKGQGILNDPKSSTKEQPIIVSLEKELRKSERKFAKQQNLQKADFTYTPSAMSKQVEKALELIEVDALLPTPEQPEYVIPRASGPKEMEITKNGEYFREEKPPGPPPTSLDLPPLSTSITTLSPSKTASQSLISN
ncbi:MAG: hypothetical protein EZS28_025787, partial [Streblomastix strix]